MLFAHHGSAFAPFLYLLLRRTGREEVQLTECNSLWSLFDAKPNRERREEGYSRDWASS